MRRRRTASCATAAAVLAAAVVATPIAAQADEGTSSDWWYDGFGVSEVHSQGWTGAGVKIAVIDEQINPDLPVFDGTNLTVADPLCEGGSPTSTKPTDDAVHGSDVTALLIGNGKGNGHVRGMAPEADVTFYGMAGCDASGEDTDVLYTAIDRAVDAGNQVISTSIGTTSDEGAASEAIAEAVAKGVVIVAASPNTVNDAARNWPWGFNGVVSVNAFGKDGKLQDDIEVSGKQVAWKETTVVAPGVNFPSVDWTKDTWSVITGSSLATPLTAGVVALAAQKFPGVSGNQLIQSLIHNTTPDDHPLSRSDDGNGYGPVSLRHVLAVDPSQYPNVNPLMDKSSGKPTVQQVAQAAGGASPAVSPTGTADAASGPVVIDAGGGVWVPVLIGAGVVVLLVVVAVIVIVIIASGRKKNRNAGGIA